MATDLTALDGLKIIDTDTHFTEWPDLWTSRAPAKYKERVPHVKQIDGVDRWFVEGDKELGKVGLSVIRANREKVYRPIQPPGGLGLDRFDEMQPGAFNIKERLKFMDSVGIYAQTSFPQMLGFNSAKVLREIQDPELRRIIMTTYADAMADVQKESGNRVFPQMLLPIWEDQATMAREARRMVEDLGCRGFVMGDRPEVLGLPAYSEPFWEPIWEICNERGTVLNFHVANSSGLESIKVGWDSYDANNALALQSCFFFMANAAALSNFIFSGLFDKYPNMKIASIESGLGWLPYYLEAMEWQLDEMVPAEFRKIKGRPREYFNKHVFVTWWFESITLQQPELVKWIGVENIIFETDYPHSTCLYPNALEHAAEALKNLDAYSRRRILQDNARELYHIPL